MELGDYPRMVPYRNWILSSAENHNIEPCLLAAVLRLESDFDAGAVNPSDPSYGIGQVKLGTANEVRPGTTILELMDPMIGIEISARYIARLRDHYMIPLPSGIDAYNVGPGNWKSGKQNSWYRDTVLRYSRELCS